MGAPGGKSELRKKLKSVSSAYRKAVAVAGKQYDGHTALGPDGQAFVAWGRIKEDGPLTHYVKQRADGTEKRLNADKAHNAHIRKAEAIPLLPFNHHYPLNEDK